MLNALTEPSQNALGPIPRITSTITAIKTIVKKLMSMYRLCVCVQHQKFQFSVKVPEIITHDKKLYVQQGAFSDFEKYLEMLEPLKKYNKLGAILFQLPPYFAVEDFSKIEPSLGKLPEGYDYAVEFRHASWQTSLCT
jgi:Protein of unknown function DUF72